MEILGVKKFNNYRSEELDASFFSFSFFGICFFLC